MPRVYAHRVKNFGPGQGYKDPDSREDERLGTVPGRLGEGGVAARGVA
ncbi:hypothetical protein J2X01_003167 [Arthrobacter ginsengisoli]|uniref:Uncharacterized protein n=1 Tax=Arthrobacter ginsengisoli TaxID=1356565 RepID=A0ABU1UFA3_9MICC|nr:hypothetical protein [Arthrobacter ginsengisoli]